MHQIGSAHATSRRARRGVVALALAGALLAACSSSSGHASKSTTSTQPATVAAARKCARPTPAPVTATPVAGSTTDWTLTSFDGAQIRLHWFPLTTATAAHPRPTVLMGPGWGLAGDTNTKAVGILGSIDINSLQQAGYNVMTWDPRGFGQSTGTVEIDSAAAEGRDVERLIDWVATQPGAQLDAKGDPRVGMIGGSYGGGIQVTVAAIDCRVDAIVPMLAWHSLVTSLDKAATPKAGWSGVLYGATAGRTVDAHIRSAYQSSTADGTIDAEDTAWFASRGPGDLVSRITAPTLWVQGTVDTLFTLDEGIQNYRIMRAHGVPTAMLWFCGGHGVCLTNQGDATRVQRASLAWLKRYLDRDTSANTGPRFDFIDQDGDRYTASDYPVKTGAPIVAHGTGTLSLTAAGGAGPAHAPAGSKDLLAPLSSPITPARAANAVNVPVNFTKSAVLVGAPRVTLTYTGTAPAGTRPTRVFAQLVDDTTGVVVGNQITPIDVTLDGKSRTTTVPLEVIAFTARSNAHVTLQLVATTVAYAQPRLGGSVHFDTITLSLPVASSLAPQ